MRSIAAPICLATLAMALAACNQRGPEPQEAATATTPDAAEVATPGEAAPSVAEAPSATRVEPVTVAADAVTVGSALGPDQAATGPKASYGLGDTVYASARGNGMAKVYWTFQDGTSHKEEEKPANGIVSFQFDSASGMRAGDYTVEIDIDDVPVGITDFVVK